MHLNKQLVLSLFLGGKSQLFLLQQALGIALDFTAQLHPFFTQLEFLL